MYIYSYQPDNNFLVNDIRIGRYTTGPGIVWYRSNTYCLVHNAEGPWQTLEGKRVDLVSVNGIGEVRWRNAPYQLAHHEEVRWLAREFGILPAADDLPWPPDPDQ